MAHVRQQIRDAVAALLVGTDTAGANVFKSRPLDAYPLQESELPAICVDTVEGGPIGKGSMAGPNRLIERVCVLTITVGAKGNTGYQDQVDAAFVEIETRLANNNQLVTLCKWMQPTGEPNTEISGDGDQPVALSRMQYDVVYITALNDPETPL